jgi:UDP-galactopyranose mutase
MRYDYLIVGAGFYGATFARKLRDAGKQVLVIDKADHVAGHAYTMIEDGIVIHAQGPHIFHTTSKQIWDFVTQFGEFDHYQHRAKATYKGKLYSLPFNMNTYYDLWGCVSPEEAKRIIDKQIVPCANPVTLEQWALSQVGRDIYEKLIYGYTKKQWHREPSELPAFIIKRLPLRFTYNDNYFNDQYQGLPKLGYTAVVRNMLSGIDVRLNTDFFTMGDWRRTADKLLFTGPIDRFYEYRYGSLEYLTLDFRHEKRSGNFQGTAAINYTEEKVPYTRIIEHKHFGFQEHKDTIITYEYPKKWEEGDEPYYPINDPRNMAMYALYEKKAREETDVIFGGRMGAYRYYNMDQVIAQALELAEREIKGPSL